MNYEHLAGQKVPQMATVFPSRSLSVTLTSIYRRIHVYLSTTWTPPRRYGLTTQNIRIRGCASASRLHDAIAHASERESSVINSVVNIQMGGLFGDPAPTASASHLFATWQPNSGAHHKALSTDLLTPQPGEGDRSPSSLARFTLRVPMQ
jgi:hypothetical protein